MDERAAAHRIGPELSVDQVIELWPRTIGVMNDLGLDTCCGGSMSLRRAARNARVPVEELLAKLEEVVRELEASPWPYRGF
jgi:iron-sulfur cluster repair protein YtfE (RIC family)